MNDDEKIFQALKKLNDGEDGIIFDRRTIIGSFMGVVISLAVGMVILSEIRKQIP